MARSGLSQILVHCSSISDAMREAMQAATQRVERSDMMRQGLKLARLPA